MAVLKTTSPTLVPSAPMPLPRNTVPSARASRAGGNWGTMKLLSVGRRAGASRWRGQASRGAGPPPCPHHPYVTIAPPKPFDYIEKRNQSPSAPPLTNRCAPWRYGRAASDAAPGRALRRVFENHPGCFQVVAYPVGFGEVLRLLGRGAGRDLRLDIAAGKTVSGRKRGLEKIPRLSLQQTEDAAERPQQPGRPGISTAIDGGGQFKQGRDGLGRVEVVVHGLAELARGRVLTVDRCRVVGHGSLERRIKAGQGVPRIVKVSIRIVERASIMGSEDEETHDFGVIFLQYLADGEEVAQRLRHLLVVDTHEAVMHPVVHEGSAVGALALRDLVLVMGKLQVGASAVDVEMFSEQPGSHRRALDVPSGAPGTPRRRPACLGGIAVLGMFPEYEVERIVFRLHDIDTLAGPQILE